MKWLRFILSHSIFIAFCADALCFQTALLLHIKLPLFFYCFIFFSTITSYNFYWLLSGFYLNGSTRIDFLRKHLSNIIVLIISIAGSVYTLFFVKELITLVGIGLLLTVIYCLPLLPYKILNFTRKGGLSKTLLLAFTWTFVTVYLPYQYVHPQNQTVLLLLFGYRFLFMLFICIIFDARDTRIDIIRGLQSLTTVMHPVKVRALLFIIILLYLANGIIYRIYINETGHISSLIITVCLLIAVYILSLKKRGYLFYYFLVDGLMLLSTLTTYLVSI